VSSYYGRPILKAPVWQRDIAWYLFSGGLAGASSTLALTARRAGYDGLARTATLTAAAAITASPVFLVRDLGRPERFFNMLRVVKPTSPMNVGSWLLAAESTATGLAALLELAGRLPRVRDGAEGVAGVLGPALATYTAVLLADTAIPVWHEARFELPLVFAGGAATSAGAAAALLAPPAQAAPARRLLVGGALVEEAAVLVMERRLGLLGDPYREGTAGRYARLARGLTLAGAGVAAGARGRRVGAALALAGAVCRRLAVFEAGSQSARDPRFVVAAQRRGDPPSG
jgi:formate-dependent nitrite reductase membrane component NrfD